MKHLLLIPLLFSLTACNKHQNILGINDVVAPIQNKTIVLMGQSNALYFSQYGGTDAFTNDIQSFAPGSVTYIQCAVGGTNLQNDWMPTKPLYQACLDKIANRKIDIIFWDQGESEAESWDPDQVDIWAMSFTSMMNTFRTAISNPTTPVLYCRLGDDPWQLPFLKQMQAQQNMVYLSNSHLVNLDGIPTDGLHYITNNGYTKVADRYAQAYKEYLQGE